MIPLKNPRPIRKISSSVKTDIGETKIVLCGLAEDDAYNKNASGETEFEPDAFAVSFCLKKKTRVRHQLTASIK